MAKRLILALAGVAVLSAAASMQSPSPARPSAAGAPVTGAVFEDRNGNGTRDAGEPGVIAAVSNQLQVVETTTTGEYQLPDAGLGVVFVSVPDGYRATGRFWQPAGAGRVDFPLVRTDVPSTFTFIHASDPHVSPQSVARLQRVGAIVGERKPAFVLVSGDLVRDALRVGEPEATGYYELYKKTTGAFGVPVWSVPGNHEIFGIERHLSLVSAAHPLYGKGMYRSHLGPNYYSFTYGGVHFVGLDSVDIEDLWYYGHIDKTQVAWLAADLARIPAGMPVVTFNHIPFVSAAGFVEGYRDDGPAPSLLKVGGKLQFRHVVSNLDEVLKVLPSARWPLALGGHFHIRETIRFESAVHTRFAQTAAIVGPGTGTIPAISGVTLYTVRTGVIDDGTFVRVE